MKSNDAERLGSVEPFKQALLEMLLKRVPKCTERILPGLYHGEFSVNHPTAMSIISPDYQTVKFADLYNVKEKDPDTPSGSFSLFLILN